MLRGYARDNQLDIDTTAVPVHRLAKICTGGPMQQELKLRSHPNFKVQRRNPGGSELTCAALWQGRAWNDTVRVQLLNPRLGIPGDTVGRGRGLGAAGRKRLLPERFLDRIDAEVYEPDFLRHFGILLLVPSCGHAASTPHSRRILVATLALASQAR